MFNFTPNEKNEVSSSGSTQTKEKISLTDLKRQLKDLLTAREAGFLIPQPMIDLVEEQIRIRRGVAQQWKCSSKKCGRLYESHVRLLEIGCQCGYGYRLIWTNPELAKQTT